jgi:predicted HicB family RNase H-like nuclease
MKNKELDLLHIPDVKQKSEMTNMSFPVELKRRLKIMAAENGVSFPELCRQVLDHYARQQEVKNAKA